MGQRRVRHVPVAGRRARVPWDLLVKDVPRRSTTTWTSSSSSSTGRRTSILASRSTTTWSRSSIASCSGPGYTDRWIDYGGFDGEQLVSAKELTLQPGAKCVLNDPGRQRLDHGAGLRPDGTLALADAGDDPLRRGALGRGVHHRRGGRGGRDDRKHRRRAAGRPAIFRPRSTQEDAGNRDHRKK